MASTSRWADERLRLGAVGEFLRHKGVPVHRLSYVYYFGGITLFFFVIQVITGLLLLMYYRPTADAAYESITFIMSRVRFGWLIRSIHSWSANLMVFWVFVHMAGAFFVRAYRRPRELTWVSGALLFLITLTFGFTGYLLPWNKLAFFATKVGTEIVGSVPWVGKGLLLLLRGGPDVTEATLTRFFGIHVAILPALTTVILGVHLLLVQIHGMSHPIGTNPHGSIPFYPNFLLREAAVWLVLLAALAALATLFPWPAGEKADPLAPAPAGIKPEWYFLFMYQTLRLLPGHILGLEGEMVGVVAFGLAALVLIAVPFLDVWAARERRHALVTLLGALAVAFVVMMTLWSLLPAREAKAAPSPPAAPAGQDSCSQCHAQLDEEWERRVAEMKDDAHVAAGLGCADCHGGNPAKEDMDEAMSEAEGFIGAPSRQETPAFCGRCHSSPDVMRKFNPSLPTDQEAQYRTSVHGKQLARGDNRVATCTNCHGVHPVRSVADVKSPVNRLNVPLTCARCHANAIYMKGYDIPTDQFEQYRRSVHGVALLERGSRLAPACNDCHGNHGAVPPGVESVANVCAQCHSATRDLFVKGPHKKAFDAEGLPECIACHGQHEIVPPTDEMVGSGLSSVCVRCHEPGSRGLAAAEAIRAGLDGLSARLAEVDGVLDRAEQLGMEVGDARLDVGEATTRLILARTTVHVAFADEVQKVVREGLEFAAKGEAAGRAALDEVRFRRRGLAVSVGLLLFAAFSLQLKLRRMERGRGSPGGGAAR